MIRLLPVVGGGNPQYWALRELIMDDAEGVVLAPGMDLSTTPWDVAQECGYGAELVGPVPLGSAFTGGAATLAATRSCRASPRSTARRRRIALAWLLQRDERILLIPGTSSMAHLEENLATAGVALDPDDMAALEEGRAGGRPGPGRDVDGPPA